MTWARLDDRMGDHPKIVGLSDKAFRAHVLGILYCAGHLTDGHIPTAFVKQATTKAALTQLIAAGLWTANGTGYVIHDYSEYNPKRDTVLAKRRATADRVARHRGSSSVVVDNAAIWERDQGICGICGRPADPKDWHLDHVVPLDAGGTHDPDNVQVSHPGCNASKSNSVTRYKRAGNAAPVPVPLSSTSTEAVDRGISPGQGILPKALQRILPDGLVEKLTQAQAESVARAWRENDVEVRHSLASVEKASNPVAYLVKVAARINPGAANA